MIMDVYGPTPQDLFRVDDLLDFSNDELFSPNSTTTSATTNSTTDSADLFHHHKHLPFPGNATTGSYLNSTSPYVSTADFTDELGVPSDDIKELEWLSNFVDDSFADFPANCYTGEVNLRPEKSLHGRARSKRSRSTSIATTAANGWTSSTESQALLIENSKTSPSINNTRRRESSVSTSRDRLSTPDVPRRCTHCASEKTPQWRTGPLGPKTLCNACGVRFKSGRLVPEYRPAASPTFVLTQHSNSHRKVLELRRQKEMHRQQQQQQMQQMQVAQQQQEQHMYGLHHFQVC